MLSENTFSKYLIYAIGEIVLVVIGILIALSINNWNENSKERVIEKSYLKRLSLDLKENKTLWEKTLDRKENQLTAAYVFLNFHFSENQDTILNILPHFQKLATWQDININQVTFNEMVSSGNLNIIKNDSIKIKLLNLDKLYKAILNNQDLIKTEYKVLLHEPTMNIINTSNAYVLDPEQRRHIQREFSEDDINVYTNQFLKDLTTLINDKVFINGVTGIIYNAEYRFKEFNQAIDEVTELIALIDEEIDKN